MPSFLATNNTSACPVTGCQVLQIDNWTAMHVGCCTTGVAHVQVGNVDCEGGLSELQRSFSPEPAHLSHSLDVYLAFAHGQVFDKKGLGFRV